MFVFKIKFSTKYAINNTKITQIKTLSFVTATMFGVVNLVFVVFVFILSAISKCSSGLKALYDPSNCTSTAQP